MILDSNYFIHLLRRDDAAFRKGMELFDAGVPTRVSMANSTFLSKHINRHRYYSTITLPHCILYR
jgi:hypothetical protein